MNIVERISSNSMKIGFTCRNFVMTPSYVCFKECRRTLNIKIWDVEIKIYFKITIFIYVLIIVMLIQAFLKVNNDYVIQYINN